MQNKKCLVGNFLFVKIVENPYSSILRIPAGIKLSQYRGFWKKSMHNPRGKELHQA